MARAAARQMSFADVELMRQGVRLEPLLAAISGFLDNQQSANCRSVSPSAMRSRSSR
jgi:hypothetical protein